MSTVFFHGKDGQITSMRTGNAHTQMTTYLDNSNRGGVTFRGGNSTTRIKNNGSVSFGLQTGRRMTYFNKNGSTSNRISPF